MPNEKDEVIENRISEVDFHRVVCPITFIGDKITNSDSVNTMYLEPYIDLKAMRNVTKECVGELSPAAKPIYDNIQQVSLYHAIDSYLNMNLYSLTYDTLIKFIQEAFKFEIENKLIPDEVTDAPAVYVVGKYLYLIGIDLQEELDRIITGVFIKPDNKVRMAEAHEIFASQMSGIFSQVVDLVFNRAINNLIDHSFEVDQFETIFDIIYYTIYDEQPTAEYKNNVQVMVQFVSGYLRQVMENQLEMYRNGLDLMTMTITGMIFGKETV